MRANANDASITIRALLLVVKLGSLATYSNGTCVSIILSDLW